MADCSCKLPAGMQHQKLSKKAVIIPFVVFGVALYIVWALWAPGALWLLGIWGVLVVGNLVFRLVRGHSVWCSVKWSPVAALYNIGEGVASLNI